MEKSKRWKMEGEIEINRSEMEKKSDEGKEVLNLAATMHKVAAKARPREAGRQARKHAGTHARKKGKADGMQRECFSLSLRLLLVLALGPHVIFEEGRGRRSQQFQKGFS